MAAFGGVAGKAIVGAAALNKGLRNGIGQMKQFALGGRGAPRTPLGNMVGRAKAGMRSMGFSGRDTSRMRKGAIGIAGASALFGLGRASQKRTQMKGLRQGGYLR